MEDLTRSEARESPSPVRPGQVLTQTAHRPYPLPMRPWRLRQRWNDLLFAHWPIAPTIMSALLPCGLELDTFDGSAWLGVVPFWMDHVATRAVGDFAFTVPSTGSFNELNLRTYVRSLRTGKRGVFFFALDCDSVLSVLGARVLFHLPYYFAAMQHRTLRSANPGAAETDTIAYGSRRRLDFLHPPVLFNAVYGPVAPVLPPAAPGTLEHFLTERYCLFTPSRGRILRGDIHHLPWPLQPAQAEFRQNSLPAAYRLTLPSTAPVLHYSRHLEVFLWSLQPER